MKLYLLSILCLLLSQVLASTTNTNNLDNKATFAGGITDGLVLDNLQCKININEVNSYVAVSKRVFEIKNICDNYVVGMAAVPEEADIQGFPMFKAKIVDRCDDCSEAQIILDHNTYKNFTIAESMASIIWIVLNEKGDVSLKANFSVFHHFTEFVGIPPEEIKRMFEERALEMVLNKINYRNWPWESDDIVATNSTVAINSNSTQPIIKSNSSQPVNNSTISSPLNVTETVVSFVDDINEEEEKESHGLVFVSVGVAAVGLVCFAGYKRKSKQALKREDSIAIPSIPAVDSSINSISDHPDGLPRIDIYNPPLEYYHFPMDSSYDICDLRPEFYEN